MDRNMTRDGLRAGFGAVDITPPVGLAMAGALDPRTNRGTSDPLLAKAIHVEGIGGTATLVGLDLIGVPRHIADAAIREASRRAGLDPASIMISASHTHSGPYMSAASDIRHLVDEAYLASLPGRGWGGTGTLWHADTLIRLGEMRVRVRISGKIVLLHILVHSTRPEFDAGWGGRKVKREA